MKLCKGDALVVVDVQNDFAHRNGTLYVKGGETIIPVVNLWVEKFTKKNIMMENPPIFFTQDWHPLDHSSFADFDGMWPVHCVQHTWGAKIHEDVAMPSKYSTAPKDITIIRKGTQQDKDEYSSFENRDLENMLLNRNIDRVFVCGLATDYCVFHTVMDGLSAGFDIVLIRKGIKGVNFNPHKEELHEVAITDSEIAIGRMVLAGAKII